MSNDEPVKAAVRTHRGAPSQQSALLYVVAGVLVVAIAAIAVARSPSLIAIFSQMGKEGLTLEELRALNMLDTFKGPIVPVELGPLGWIAVIGPMAFLALAGARAGILERSGPPFAMISATFWPICVILGLSAGLVFAYRNPGPRYVFLACALVCTLGLHAQLEKERLLLVGKVLLGGLISTLGIGLLSESWALAGTLACTAAVAVFGMLLFYDLQDLGQPLPGDANGEGTASVSMFKAIKVVPSLAGVAISLVLIVL